MTNDCDAVHVANPNLENSAVAYNFYRRRSISASFARQQPARSPGAAFENLCQWHRGRIESKSLSQAVGDAVEQRHRQRPPFHDQGRGDLVFSLRSIRIAKREHAAIDEQSAV